MNIAEMIAAKQAELVELKSAIIAGDAEAIEKSDALVKELEGLEDRQAKADAAMAKMKGMGAPAAEDISAKSLGEHFAQALKKSGMIKGGSRFDVAAPEFKASGDTQLTPASVVNALTTIDTNVVEAPRTRLVIRDLFGAEVISGSALEYYVERAMEGSPAVTPEGTLKPQIHFADPTKHTVTLDKIAEFIKESDEYIADAPFLASAINGRLLYQLFLAEQNYLVEKLVNTSGIQTDTTSWTASIKAAELADIIFGACTDVDSASGYAADAIVMHPATWQIIRLGKDNNGQYYGGGYFADGQGKTLWGVPVVTTTAVTASQIIVGAFKTCGSVVSKGGYKVEATNTDKDDFEKNLMTIRAEERLALAVRRPAGFKLITKA
ncbi:MAG: phage major capsid protein [Bacteroidales bacterium]|nr:phage major capsid protein [Bacteroidales bacterium]